MRSWSEGLKLLLPLLLLYQALPGTAAQAGGWDKAKLVQRFDLIETGFHNGDGYSLSTNEAGELAWGESYLLEAYINMYQGTGELKYLNKFVKHADRVIGNTDAARKIKDYKGRSLAGWSATKYTNNGERAVGIVDTGMISYPLALFALAVQEEGLTGFEKQAERYQGIAAEAVAIFDGNWVLDRKSGEGHYQFDREDPTRKAQPYPMPVPFNRQLALGRTHIILSKLTGSRAYRDKATALAKHFRANLRLESDGAYVWDYWYGNGLKLYGNPENISYAAMDLDFVMLAYGNDIVFTEEDIGRFLTTYESRIYRNGKFSDYVTGKNAGNTYLDAVGRLQVLSEVDCSPWRHFKLLLEQGRLSMHPQVMLGITETIKHYNECSAE